MGLVPDFLQPLFEHSRALFFLWGGVKSIMGKGLSIGILLLNLLSLAR